jgi:hypothetical protein
MRRTPPGAHRPSRRRPDYDEPTRRGGPLEPDTSTLLDASQVIRALVTCESIGRQVSSTEGGAHGDGGGGSRATEPRHGHH